MVAVLGGHDSLVAANDAIDPEPPRKQDCRAVETTQTQKIEFSIRKFFETNQEKRISVVVVLDTPQPEVSFTIDPKTNKAMPRISAPQTKLYEDAKREVQNELERLGVKPTNWLDNAQSFVANLNETELKKISEHPLICEIVPNENLATDQ